MDQTVYPISAPTGDWFLFGVAASKWQAVLKLPDPYPSNPANTPGLSAGTTQTFGMTSVALTTVTNVRVSINYDLGTESSNQLWVQVSFDGGSTWFPSSKPSTNYSSGNNGQGWAADLNSFLNYVDLAIPSAAVNNTISMYLRVNIDNNGSLDNADLYAVRAVITTSASMAAPNYLPILGCG